MKIRIIGIVVAAIVVVGGLVGGWFFYFKEPEPPAVLQKMMQVAQSAHSFHYAAALSMGMDVSGFTKFKQFAAGEGSLFFTPDEKSIESNLLINGDVVMSGDNEITAHQGKIDFYIAGSKSPNPLLTLSADTRTIDKVTYGQLTSLKFPIPMINLSPLLNKWMTFDGEKILNDLDKQKEAITGEKPVERGVTAAQRAELKKLALETDFFTSIEKLPLEKIDSRPMHHYRVKLNVPETRKYVEKSLEIIKMDQVTNDKETVDKLFEKLPDLSLEFWIGKRDFLVYREKITWPFTVEEPNTTFGAQGSTEVIEKIPVQLSATINLSNYNQAVAVSAPAGARDYAAVFQDAMTEILPGILGIPQSGQ